MDGKRLVYILIGILVIGLLLTWIWMEFMIEEYDLERATSFLKMAYNGINFNKIINL